MILHINLAKGWRGGEQQTWLLMETLAHRGVRQLFLGRSGSALSEAVAALPGVTLVPKQALFLSGRSFFDPSTVVHAHEARAVYVAWWLSKRYQFPYIITRRMQQPPKKRPLTIRAYRGAAAHVGVSTAACRAIQSRLPNAKPILIHSVHDGKQTVTDGSQAIRTKSLGAQDFLIGHAGAMVDGHKGQSLFIKSVGALQEKGLKVAGMLMGDGIDRAALEVLAERIADIHFVGQVQQVSVHLSALDLFVFPSLHEGLGSVLLEVMMCRVPIVASSAGGIPDLIQHEKTGLLVPPGDQDALNDAVERLLLDKALAAELATNAYQLAQSKTPEAMADAYQIVYRDADS